MENLLNYITNHFLINELTGEIERNDRKNSTGSFDKDGYKIIKIKGKQIKSHRLAWFLYYGEFPNMEIDHINRNRTDNRKSNLRLATRKENVNNTTKKVNPETNQIGIYIDKTDGLLKKYALKLNNKTYRFYSIEEAINFKTINTKQ